MEEIKESIESFIKKVKKYRYLRDWPESYYYQTKSGMKSGCRFEYDTEIQLNIWDKKVETLIIYSKNKKFITILEQDKDKIIDDLIYLDNHFDKIYELVGNFYTDKLNKMNKIQNLAIHLEYSNFYCYEIKFRIDSLYNIYLYMNTEHNFFVHEMFKDVSNMVHAERYKKMLSVTLKEMKENKYFRKGKEIVKEHADDVDDLFKNTLFDPYVNEKVFSRMFFFTFPIWDHVCDRFTIDSLNEDLSVDLSKHEKEIIDALNFIDENREKLIEKIKESDPRITCVHFDFSEAVSKFSFDVSLSKEVKHCISIKENGEFDCGTIS